MALAPEQFGGRTATDTADMSKRPSVDHNNVVIHVNT